MWRNVARLTETAAHSAEAPAAGARGGNDVRAIDRGPEHPRAQEAMLTLDHYASVATHPDWTDADRYRAIVCNLPRRLHGLDAQSRRRVLSSAPPLTGTPWDALLAATAEHVARRHADPLPPWMNEPERFVAIPWFATTRLDFMRWEALVFTPAAFARHGTPVHPSDLDTRGGDEPWEGGR